MKISIIGTAYPYKGGGISTFNERMGEALLQLGHDVDIITFTLQYPSFLYPGKTQYSNESAPKGIKIRRLINSVNPLSWIKTGWKLRQEKPDVIIVRFWLPFFGPSFGTLLRIARGNKHSKVICIADNIIPHEKRMGDQVFTRYFLPCVDAFLCMSREVLKDVQRLAPKKPAVFHPHPLYDNFGEALSKAEARNRLQLPVYGKFALFFGFIRQYKGLDLLLEAMAHPEVKAQDIHLIIAGEYFDDPTQYRQWLEQPELEGRLHAFTDFIPNEEVRLYFSAADLVVQPYRSATQSGITQIAYHFNKPMVVTHVGGLAENVPDGKAGFVVAPDAAAIAQAITRFFTEKREVQMQAEMLQLKQQYSWEAFCDTLLALTLKK